MTYWAINAFFLAAAGAVAVVATVLVARGRRVGIAWRSLLVALVIVLAMTAVFDNVMIGIGLVDYDPARISGVFVGIAPLEDFAYAVAGVILLPALWIVLGERMARRSPHPPAHVGSAQVESAHVEGSTHVGQSAPVASSPGASSPDASHPSARGDARS